MLFLAVDENTKHKIAIVMERKIGRGRQGVYDMRERRWKKSQSEEDEEGSIIKELSFFFFLTHSVCQPSFHTGKPTPASVTYTHLSVTFS